MAVDGEGYTLGYNTLQGYRIYLYREGAKNSKLIISQCLCIWVMVLG